MSHVKENRKHSIPSDYDEVFEQEFLGQTLTTYAKKIDSTEFRWSQLKHKWVPISHARGLLP